MSTSNVQKQTKNYSAFEFSQNNRLAMTKTKDGGVKPRPRSDLLKSMKKDGFWRECPIVCRHVGNGKMLVIDGHNRLVAAMALNLPVEYIAYSDDESGPRSPLDFIQGQKGWRGVEVCKAYALTNPHYAKLMEFSKEHGIGLPSSVQLLAGRTGESIGDATSALREGRFEVRDEEFANRVSMALDALKKHVEWYRHRGVVSALSAFLRVDGFSVSRMIDKIDKFPELLRKQPDRDSYLLMFEGIYNHQARDKKPLRIEAIEAGKRRREEHVKNLSSMRTH